tara:strand:- start:160 stop:561 length:402 start_codon:yes stop_codon:yes gene_type:complete
MPNYYRSGLGAVGAYQVSGRPYITGSNNALAAGAEDTITFPSVTRTVTVINTDVDSCDIHVHFNSKTSGNVTSGLHYVALNSLNDAMSFNVKCKEVYISNPDGAEAASYTVVAELTGIDVKEMFALTGSGLTE